MLDVSAPPDASPDLAAAALAHVERLARDGCRRAFVLGATGRCWAGLLAGRGLEVTVQEDSCALSQLKVVDLVLAIGVLEHTRWDRWILQQAHAALRDGGHLLLAVPNELAVTSAQDLGRWTARMLERVGARSTRANITAERRYYLPKLIETLETLGYAVERCSSHTFGWLAPLARMVPELLRVAAGNHLLLCARLPSLFGPDPRRPYPDPVAHCRRYETRHRRSVKERDRWAAHHPRYRRVRVQRLDPARYRGARVLTLAPHPDDEIIGCGGTLAKLVAHGASITIVHATDGADTAGLADAPPEVRGSLRLDEARDVGTLMGFASLELWREDNAAFAERDDLVERLARTLAAVQPGLVFVPFVTDDHPDHRAMCRMLARAIARVPAATLENTRVLAYEIWNLVPATVYCDVTDVVGLQEQALLRYATAMRAEDYVHACQDRNYYNAWAVGGFRGFAEVFVGVPARDFPDLMANEPDM